MAGPDSEPVFGSARMTVAEAREATLASSPALRYRWVLALGLAGYAAWQVPSLYRPTPGGMVGVITFVLVAAVVCMTFLLAPYLRGRKMLAAIGGDRGEIRYRLDAEGLTVQSPGSAGTVSWRVIERYRETPLTFLVFTAGLARIVPKSAFTPADLERVRALLAANIGPAGTSMERKS